MTVTSITLSHILLKKTAENKSVKILATCSGKLHNSLTVQCLNILGQSVQSSPKSQTLC